MLPTDCQEFSNSGDEARGTSSPASSQPPEVRPQEESLRAQVETYLAHLNTLIRRGRELREILKADPISASAMGATRAWQEDCGITVNQLSGGSKAHWLARSFSQAFLMRAENGHAVERAAPGALVERLLGVLEQGVASLSPADHGPVTSASSEAPAPRLFEFLHHPELRPVVEQAYRDSRRALEQHEYQTALLTSCGILEAIVTDALEHKGLSALIASGAPAEKISDWSFETRLAVAERAGLIRGGCARLPAIARAYRDQTGADGGGAFNLEVSERDAKLAGQVLRVVMRDLDPGR